MLKNIALKHKIQKYIKNIYKSFLQIYSSKIDLPCVASSFLRSFDSVNNLPNLLEKVSLSSWGNWTRTASIENLTSIEKHIMMFIKFRKLLPYALFDLQDQTFLWRPIALKNFSGFFILFNKRITIVLISLCQKFRK